MQNLENCVRLNYTIVYRKLLWSYGQKPDLYVACKLANGGSGKNLRKIQGKSRKGLANSGFSCTINMLQRIGDITMPSFFTMKVSATGWAMDKLACPLDQTFDEQGFHFIEKGVRT